MLRLNRDVEVTQQIYTQMLNTMQELRIARAGTVGNVRILDEALVSAEPTAPRRNLIVVISLLAGMMLGLMLVLVRHMLRRGVESVEQIQACGLQAYATIPLSEQQGRLNRLLPNGKHSHKKSRFHFGPFSFGKPLTNHTGGEHKVGRSGKQADTRPRVLAFSDPTDLAVEALRSLRTSLHFAMLEAKNNVLMLTGPSPAVGKSFVSTNLGVVCAQSGQRVLLIDGDLREGHLHSLLGEASEKGLSDILAGKLSMEEATRRTEDENLNYITRDTAPPNPSELLMNERFTQLLEKASEQYDLVLIDTPPALAVTDAAIVGKQAGTSLMVVRFQANGVKEIERSAEQLLQAGVQVKGAILNAVMRTATSYYGYGYGYYRYDYRTEEKS